MMILMLTYDFFGEPEEEEKGGKPVLNKKKITRNSDTGITTIYNYEKIQHIHSTYIFTDRH